MLRTQGQRGTRPGEYRRAEGLGEGAQGAQWTYTDILRCNYVFKSVESYSVTEAWLSPDIPISSLPLEPLESLKSPQMPHRCGGTCIPFPRGKEISRAQGINGGL